MSVVTLAQAKRNLRVTHDSDDPLIEEMIDGAEDELKQFLDRDELPRRDDPCADCESDSTANPASDSDDLAPAVRRGVLVLVQAQYDGATADEIDKARKIAFDMVRGYRCRMGV